MKKTINNFFNKTKFYNTKTKILKLLYKAITNMKYFVENHPYLFLALLGFLLLILDYLIIYKLITIMDQNYKIEACKTLELKKKVVELNKDLAKIKINQATEVQNLYFKKKCIIAVGVLISASFTFIKKLV